MAGTVLVLQHVACETLGTIELALQSHGLQHRHVRIHEGDEVPADLGDAAALIVMGGPMSVYDHDQLTHLKHEMRLIESALKAQRPVLGVCLGSQLLAHVLGARVYPAQQKEIGWHTVKLSQVAEKDAIYANAPDEFTAFHWHGDVFDLPPNTVSLASSELTRCQSYRFGDSVYGILFHMEVTQPQVIEMAARFPEDLAQTGVSEAQLQAGAQQHLSHLTRIGQDIFGGWSQLAVGEVVDVHLHDITTAHA